MNTFSFRAECTPDVERFCKRISLLAPPIFKVSTTRLTISVNGEERATGEVAVEVETTLDLECLRDTMRQVVDGHVMLQTLRELPLAKNQLERDYDLE